MALNLFKFLSPDEEERKRRMELARQNLAQVTGKARTKIGDVGEKAEVALKKFVSQRFEEAKKKETKPLKFIGKQLQKAPEFKIPKEKVIKPLRPLTGVAEFVPKMVGEQVRSWGRTMEGVATPRGRRLLAESAKEIKKKPLTLETLQEPAFEAALDISDVLPGGLLFSGGIKMVGKGAVKRAGKKALLKGVSKEVSVLENIQKGFKAGRKAKLAKRTPPIKNQLLDRLSPVFDLVKKAGKELPAEKNPYKRLRLMAGVGGKIEAVLDRGLTPVLKKEKNRLDDLSSLLILERNQEILERGLKTRYSKEKIAQGITELQSKYGPQGMASLRQSAHQVRQYANSLLDYTKDAGIISDKAYAAIRKKNQLYVPFEIVDYIADNVEAGKFVRSSFNVASQDVIKTLKGSEKAVVDPLEALVRRTAKTVSLADKNIAMQKLVDLRKVSGNLKKLIYPIKRDAPKNFGKVNLFIKGKNKSYAVPEEVATAIKNLDGETSNILVKLLSPQAKLLRAGATGLNIGFIPANVVRDIADAFFVTYSQKGLKTTARLLASFPRAIATAAKKGDLYQKWLASGAAQSTMTEQIFRRTTKTVKELSGRRSIIKKVITSPKSLIEFANRVGEQSTRIARFQAGLKGGESALEAGFQARDVTVDFAKAGNVIKVLNQIIPFLNAGIQGTERMLRAIKNNPVRAGVGLSTLVGVPTVSLYLHNRKFADYKDIPQYEKDLNWIIIARDRTPEEIDRGDKIRGIKVPKGHMLMPFANITEAFLQFVNKDDPRSLSNLILETTESLSPIGLPVDKERIGKTIATITPPGLQATAEVVANRDFFRNLPIVPRALEEVEPKQQYTEKTPPLYIKAGQVTGASPIELEHFVETTTGGLGRQLGEISKGEIKKGTVGQITRRFTGIRGGTGREEEFERVSELREESKTASYQRKKAAEKLHEEYKNLSIEEANARALALKKSDPALYSKLVDVIEEEKLGLTSLEKYIKSLPVTDGTRAKYVHEKLSTLSNKEEKNRKVKEWQEKKIISKNVYSQLIKLIAGETDISLE